MSRSASWLTFLREYVAKRAVKGIVFEYIDDS